MNQNSTTTSKRSVKIVSQFFHPDSSANSTVLTELAVGLEAQGFDVTALVGQPSYSRTDRKSPKQPTRDEYEGVSIRRIPATRFDKDKGVIWRMVNEVSFFIVAFLKLLFARQKPDVLLIPTSPPFLPVAGWLLKKLRGYDYVPIVFDVYPDAAVELGYFSQESSIYKVWEWLNKRAYANADRVVTIGDTMRENIAAKSDGKTEIDVIHNWEDGSFISPQSKTENPFSREHGLVEKLVFIYSGNLGLYHGIEPVVEAAAEVERQLTDPTEKIELLLIGEGGKKKELKKRARELNLKTTTFLPYQPWEVVPNSLTSGDVSLVTMRADMVGICVPSKFYTALASGQAVLAVATEESEIGRIVSVNECGIRVDPDSPSQIAEAIKYWLENPDEVERMGERARTVFETKFTRSRAIEQYRDTILQVTQAD